MISWLLTQPKTFVLDKGESPPADKHDLAKIKIDACIVSSTDLRLYNGAAAKDINYPIVPGRHGAGVISEISDENEFCLKKGDRVVVDPYMPCGSCLYCRTNQPQLCTDYKILGLSANGLYTNFTTLKCGMLHRIPDQMSNETALFTEYAALALSIIDKINLKEGDHIAIFSANKLGFILAQLAAYYQGITISIEDNEEQLEKLAAEQLGFTINPVKSSLAQTVKEITGGRKCEKVVYMANPVTTLNDAIDCCGHNGVLCLAGFTLMPSAGDFSEIQRKQLTVVSVTNGHKNFQSAINLLATKTIKLVPPISEKINFNDVPEAFAKLDYLKARYCSPEIIID